MSRPWPKRHRSEEEIRRLTAALRSRQLPGAFYDLLASHGVDIASAILVTWIPDQCSYCGTLIAARATEVRFDFEFSGSHAAPGSLVAVNEWDETPLERVLADRSSRSSRSVSHPYRITLGLTDL